MSDRMNDLRNEAKQLTESFSPSLHARVMANVHAEATPIATRPIQPFRYALAAAAIVALVFVLKGAIIRTMHPAPPKLATKDFTVPNPLPEVTSIRFSTDSGNPAYAYLDHDAKAFGQFLVKQLDVMPSLK
jgi:hypothetical protein